MNQRLQWTIPRGLSPYTKSVTQEQGVLFALVRDPEGAKRLYTTALDPQFAGTAAGAGRLCPLTAENLAVLQRYLPWLRPQRSPAGPSFGFGDRLGLATPGHIRALAGRSVFPVFAQQSVRENSRTGRDYSVVLVDAAFGAFQEGYRSGFGADADHLQTVEDALHAAKLGYTYFTCDPSRLVVNVEGLTPGAVDSAFADLKEGEEWYREYVGHDWRITGLGTLCFSPEDLKRAAVKYGNAIGQACTMYGALSRELGDGFDFEISVDETDTPTTALEHVFLALELSRRQVNVQSLALRFPGTMEKAVDWSGDFAALGRELAAHSAVARALGPYRLSLHSGSDKFSLYRTLARYTRGCWHVKTAGTSYLVALGVVAHRDAALFRDVFRLALERFPSDRASYSLSADLTRVPPVHTLPDCGLLDLLSQADCRQVLHVTYGSILRSPLGQRIMRVLDSYEEEYYAALASHFGKHLDLLEVTERDQARS